MKKVWYPVIDYMLCTECGTCVMKCPHGVYDIEKAPSPVVKNPEVCIEHCHGCGNRCPVGAITYVGEDTEWSPPNSKKSEGESCCSSSGCGDIPEEKKVVIDYLYLDLHTCDRCIKTGNALDEVMMILTPALQVAGYKVEYRKIEIKTEEMARRYRFLSSPTIRVNGHDICQSVAENNCKCCSEISSADVGCRVFEYNGETLEVAPREMLAEAIFLAVFGSPEGSCSCGGYVLPENLRIFFEGKKK
jgi:NAD-dependent dihydropyrimidine dehydrogenase PreA subunit/glutaredoxin